MAYVERASSRIRLQHALAALASVAVVSLYFALPDGQEHPADAATDGAMDDRERIEITGVMPPDPYPGSSLFISYAASSEVEPVRVYAGKVELDVIGRHPGEVVARLAPEVAPGTTRLRLTAVDGELHKDARSKPFFLHVRAVSWRRVLASLLGGVGLIGFGSVLLSRGVRGAAGLVIARAVTRAARLRSVAYVFGTLIGALVQSTTSAAAMLAAFHASGVLPLAPAALAFVGAQGGAALAPLLVSGFVPPFVGLIAVAIGVLWLSLAADRRALSMGRMLLGAGLLAFGLQVLDPALEPFVSNPVLLSLGGSFRADTVANVVICALAGTVLVALLQGPVPLVLLILAVARATGRWDLTTALALLAGTSLGSALASLLTVSAGKPARTLARAHLLLGGIGTILSTSCVGLWSKLTQMALPMHDVAPSEVADGALREIGLPLAVGFGVSQVSAALALAALAPHVSRWLLRGVAARRPALEQNVRGLRLDEVLDLQQTALDAVAELAQRGARKHGRLAEYALADASEALRGFLDARCDDLADEPTLQEAGFASLQLQRAVASLLGRTEHVVEARIANLDPARAGTESALDDATLRELHELVSGGVAAIRKSLRGDGAPDLDEARAREIKINRLESNARRVLHERALVREDFAQELQVLQVVDAYEVVGNQVYRLAEVLGHGGRALGPRGATLAAERLPGA